MAYLTNSSRAPEDLLEMSGCRNGKLEHAWFFSHKQMVLIRIHTDLGQNHRFRERLPQYVEELIKAQ